MQRKPKRLMALLLSVMMMVGLFAAMPITASASDFTWDGTNAVAANGDTITLNGGAWVGGGTLTVPAAATVTIEGTATSATWIAINIGAGATVVWQADYTTTNNVQLDGSGTFDVAAGSISSSATTSTTIGTSGGSSVKIRVSGGTVETTANGSNAISASNSGNTITVTDGTVKATGGRAISSSAGAAVTVEGGNVTAMGGYAIYSTGTVNMTGGTVSATTGVAIWADTVNVSGGTVKSTGYDSRAIVSVAGSVTVFASGIVETTGGNSIAIVNENGTVNVSGNGKVEAKGVGDYAIYADGGTVTLTGGTVSATTGTAIEANEVVVVGTATVSNNGGTNPAITLSGADARVFVDGGDLTVNGNIEAIGTDIAVIWCEGGTVNITGNITATGTADCSFVEAIYCTNGGTVNMTGNIIVSTTFETNMLRGIETGDDGGDVTLTGNISVTGKYATGVEGHAGNVSGTVAIGGNISVTGANSRGINVDYAEIFVTGNVSASGTGNSGVRVASGGVVTVDGAITATTYVLIGDAAKTPTDITIPTTKAGYNTYTFDGNMVVGENTVWVKAPTATYIITFNANGGSVTPASATTGADGKLASLPTPTRSNYSFDGWFAATSGGTQITTSYVFSANTTIYAQWTHIGDGGGDGGSTTPSNPSGSFSGSSAYKQGSATGIIFIVSKDFSQFSNVKVGSTALTQDKDYKAEHSSTKITLLPAYLDTLKAGTYTLTVNFKDGTYTTASFTVKEADLIPITPEKPINPFTDVKGTDWFIDTVIFVYDKGLMTGTSISPMLFSPNMTLTRGMVVTVLYRMEGTPDVSGLSNPFDDVTVDAYYADAIKWAADKKIVSGYGNGKFGPNDNITREQMATILLNYELAFDKIPMDIVADRAFSDWNAIADWAKNAVNRLTMQGIINGKSGNLFDPKGNATRAEFTTVLMKFVEALER